MTDRPALPYRQIVFLVAALLIAAGVLALAPQSARPAYAEPAGGVIYVDIDAAGPTHDGSSWTNAYTNPQDALAAWTVGDEIWIAEGRYFPTVGGVQPADPRAASFSVLDGMQIYGGFDGTEATRAERDPSVHFTVLSGDIDKNDQLVDVGIAPPGVTPSYVDIVGENSYHVIENGVNPAVGDILHTTIILDGLAISAGNAIIGEPNAGPVTRGRGGGARFTFQWEPGTLIMRNILVRGNRSDLEGGGIHQSGGGLEITNSEFIFNEADDGDCVNLMDDFGRTWGGGLMTQTNIPKFDLTYDPIRKLENVQFTGNYAEFGGGYMNFYANAVAPMRSNQWLKNVHFDANRAVFQGGGMFNFKTAPKLEHVVFTDNIVESCATIPPPSTTPPACNPDIENCGRFSDIPIWGGGGLFNVVDPGSLEAGPGPELTNVQFSGNQANSKANTCTDYDGFGGAMVNQNANTTLNNVLFSGNQSENSGGAVFNVISKYAEHDHTVAVNNTTFAANSNSSSKNCGHGMGLAQANLANVDGKLQNAVIKNSVLWGPYQNGAFPVDDLQRDPNVFPFVVPDTLRMQQSIVEGCGNSGAGWPSGASPRNCGVDDGNNVDADPIFVQNVNFINAPTGAGNFRLQGASPALDTGDDALIPAGVTTDLDGNPRIIDGDGNGVSTVDRGAYEHLGCPTTSAGTIFVNGQATGANNGLTWENAFIHLQDAIDLYAGCTTRSPVKAIWVAKGIYYPDQRTGVSPSLPASKRSDLSFSLLNNGDGGVQIYGGFVGGEDSLSKRDPENNATVLSGDIERDDKIDANGVTPSPDKIVGVNSQHIVQDQGTDCAGGCPLLDGFTITGGHATGDGSQKAGQGGGIWSEGGSSILQNLSFEGNQATRGGGFYMVDSPGHIINTVRLENNWAGTGGGIAIEGDSKFSLDRVTFQSNQAKPFVGSISNSGDGGGMYFASTFSNEPISTIGLKFYDNMAASDGGGLFTTRPADFDIRLRLQQPVFERNQAASFGGAMANEDSSPYVDLGFFQGNQAQIGGGAISNRNGSDLVIFDSLLSGNKATDGGGTYNEDSSPELTNVTFSGNLADGDGGAIKNEGTGTADIRNTIAWQNSSGITSGPGATPVMSYSLIQGCTVLPDSRCPTDGGGNVEPNDPSDPVFMSPIDPANAPSTQGDFHLDINSEAVDVGNDAYNDHHAALGGVEDSTSPISPRKLDGNGDGTVTIDMGAYEAPAAGRIRVIKETQPAGSPIGFFFELANTAQERTTFALLDGEVFDSGNLTPGIYGIDERANIGWVLDSVVCSDGSTYTNIDLAAGETVTCTFKNVQEGKITIDKHAEAGATGFNFSGSLGDFTLDDGGSKSTINLSPGFYSVVEAIHADYRLSGLTCVDSDPRGQASSGDVASRTANIKLDAGETVSCNFTNAQADTITVEKITIPAGNDSFDFGGTLGDFSVAAGKVESFANQAPGSYTITEGDPASAGYVLTDITCVDSATGQVFTGDLATRTVDLSLVAGERVHCTFTNTKLGTVVIKKETVPGGGANFAFDGSFGPFTLNDGGSKTAANLTAGSYTVTEAEHPNYKLTGLTCVDSASSSPSTGDVATRTATINLAPGETVTCTFTNTEDDTITVEKVTIPAANDSFGFGGALGDFSVAGGQLKGFGGLSAGSYSIIEDDPTAAGYALTGISCVDSVTGQTFQGNTGTRRVDMVLVAGEAVHCTFTNTKLATVVIRKLTAPGAGTDFKYSGSLGNFSLDDGQNETVVNLLPGSYGVTEESHPNYKLSGLTCVDGDPGGHTSIGDVSNRTANIKLDPGETVTCTFTSTEDDTITVEKVTIPASGANFGFGGSLGDFTVAGGQVKSFTNRSPGRYTIIEDDPTPAAYKLTSIVCVDSATGKVFPGDLTSRSVDLDLVAGERVHCTFTNVRSIVFTFIMRFPMIQN